MDNVPADAAPPAHGATTLRAEPAAVLTEMARAYAAGDAEGCAALFTQKATIHSPLAPPARGRAEIEALHRDWTREAAAKRFDMLECGGCGDVAWALARFSEGAATGEGVTLAVFEREPGAGWLVRTCSLTGATA